MLKLLEIFKKKVPRVGHGYDVHRLVEGRDLIICGLKIPFEKGLLGHSDADVATHAVADALLGACGLNDIGTHFSNTDEKFKDFESLKFLEIIAKMLKQKNYKISNIDLTIVAEAPKIAPYTETMKKNLAKSLKIKPEKINIKATTEETLGLTGKGEGILAHCVTLIY